MASPIINANMSYAGYKTQYRLSTLFLTEKAAVRTALQIGIHVNKGDPFQKTLKRALRHLYLGRMTGTDLAAAMACLQSCAKHLACTNGLSACSRETKARATASNEMLQALQKMQLLVLDKA